MARTELGDTSVISSTNKIKHEVFMSFNGKEIGNSFANHMYIALNKKGFEVYEENNGRQHDERSRKKIYDAIEQSQLSIVVVSVGYVESPWCLDELVKILECRNSHEHVVLPVFYNHMEPGDAAEQTGRCTKAFAEHEEKFPDEMFPGKVKKWRSALTEVSKLTVKGLSLRETNWYRAPLRENIIQEVWKIIGKRRINVSLDIYGSKETAQSIGKWMEDVVKIWNQTQLKQANGHTQK